MRITSSTVNEQFGPYSSEDIISLEELSSEAFWQKLIEIQKQAREIFKEDFLPLIKGEKEKQRLPWKPDCFYNLTRAGDALEIRLSFIMTERDHISQFPLQNLEAAAIDRLYELMDGLPLSAVRECRECKKVFVQLKGKPRAFCQDRCMNRWHSRERRKADRNGYNEKQKILMQKRYEEKQKKIHGDNVKITKKRRR